jgi:hypothetical protein
LINRDRRGPLRGLVLNGGFKAFFEAHRELCCGTYRSEWLVPPGLVHGCSAE